MSYSLKWNPQVLDYLDKLPKEASRRIVKKITSVVSNPFSFLEHYEGANVYKLRIGDYRALIEVDFDSKILKVRYVNHRSIVYKRFGK